jgi:hypothetical protein
VIFQNFIIALAHLINSFSERENYKKNSFLKH